MAQSTATDGLPDFALPGDYCVGENAGATARNGSGGREAAKAEPAPGSKQLSGKTYVSGSSDPYAADANVPLLVKKDAPATAMSGMPTAHPDNPAMAQEHAALLALVSPDMATDVAISDGSWFDGATWQSGAVPRDGARVLIPAGLSLSYDGIGDARLFSLRIDGTLRFATDRDSRMIIDTLVVVAGGRLEIGTADQPMAPEVTAEILIDGDGDIDVRWDPLLLSRGVLSHGQVEIHGAEKTAFLKVAEAPKRGDSQLVLAAAPQGWRVGDRIVVTGTLKRGWAWDNETATLRHHVSQDEVVTITAVDGANLWFDRPLIFNHYAPREDLAAYVANITRNVVFASLGGAGTPVQQRGHVMFMHSDAVDVRFAGFDHLGRTDKSRDAFDFAALAELLPASNIKGRYPLHLHRTGMANQQAPAMVVGNAVVGSPGWGYVHHSSHADFVDNVAFDVFGAAYAAEDGDETGIWLRNIAIRSPGQGGGTEGAKTGAERHDNGRTGDGFFFAGRLVEAVGNVAANTTHGFVWMHRSAPSGPAGATLHQTAIAYGRPVVEPDKPPIQGFRDNEAFGTDIGLVVIKANSHQGHDVRSVMDGFLNWETGVGVDISYSGHYTLIDFDLLGTTAKGFFAPETGVYIGTNAFDIVVNRIRLARFPVGFNLEQGHTYPVAEADLGFALIDVAGVDLGQTLRSASEARVRVLTAEDLEAGRLEALPQRLAIAANEDFALLMDKHDSLGRTPRQKAGDAQIIYRWEVPDLLRSTGYYTAPDGRNLALVPDFVADRATGALKMLSVMVELNIPEAELAAWGVEHKGVLDPDDAPPVALDDTASTMTSQPVIIAPLANDGDPEGGPLVIGGVTDPRHGDLVLLDDDRLLYRPNIGYQGADEFTYWVGDSSSNFAPATVRITVGDQ